MHLYIGLNQGENLRRGKECGSSTTNIEVDPTKLPEEDRNLLADRMKPGEIAVYSLSLDENGNKIRTDELIYAHGPDYEGLMDAVRQNEREVRQALSNRQY